MKAKIEITGHQIQEAVEEYFTRRNMPAGPGSVYLSATPAYDSMDRPLGSYTFSATVEIDIGDPVAH